MRLEQLTFTRFLAAISIVIFHYGGKSFIFNNPNVDFIFRNANICVSYFFILSGFVMMLAYGAKSHISPLVYFKNRFARIYPVYFLAILLTLFIQVKTKTIDLPGLFLNVFMIQSWLPGEFLSFNPPGWSLSVELVFYAVFPFVFNKVLQKSPIKKSVLFIVLFWIFSQLFIQTLFLFYPGSTLTRMDGNPLMHLNEFLIGNLVAFLFMKKSQKEEGNYDFQILILFGMILLALKFPFGLHYNNGLMAILFVPLIVLISLNNGIITKIFRKKAFVFLGEISYGIYILQCPIYSLFSAYSVNKYLHITDPTIVFLLRFIILIIVSGLSYIYIEKPIKNIIRLKRVKPLVVNSL